MPSVVLTVFGKELIDSSRDRRSLSAALLYSLLGPLVMGLALGSLAAERGAGGALEVGVHGADHAPSLVRFLEAAQVEIVATPAAPERAVAVGDLDLALIVPLDHARDFLDARPAAVRLVFDESRSESRRAAERLAGILEAYGRQIADLRLAARGVSPRLVRPLEVRAVDVSTPVSRAAVALAMLPIFLMVAAFVGGMNVAIDVTAGERERRSMEGLLLHAVPRISLAIGKWLAAAVVNLAAVALTVAVSWWVLRSDLLDELGVDLAFGGGRGWGVAALLMPVVLLAPALQLVIGLFCRSYKEAQTYLSLLLFVPMLPGFFLAFGTFGDSAWMEVVPLVGQQLLLSRLLRGELPGAGTLALLAAATLLAAAILVVLAGRLHDHERMVTGG